jgi:hypothetical protein
VEVKIWFVTVMHPTGSKNIAVNYVTSGVERIQHHLDIQKNAVKRLLSPIKSEVVCED